MHTKELVQSIATARRSEGRVPRESWRKFGERIFYVPLQTVRNTEERGGGKKVRFLIQERASIRVVPAFSTEDLLFEWSAGGYQFLPIAGADLVLALPPGLSIELDPGTEDCVILSPGELQTVLREADPGDSSEEAPGSDPAAETEREHSAPRMLVPPPANQVESRLEFVLARYPAVCEGYYLGSDESSFGGLLGVLILPSQDGSGAENGDAWDTEQRFSLVEEIAELARELYGYAGAIEVYDDLANEASRSWDLFKAQHLFYRRETEQNGPSSEFRRNAELSRKAKNVIGVVPGARLRQNEGK